MLTFSLSGAFAGGAMRSAIKAAIKDAVTRIAYDVREGVIMNLRGSPLRTRSGSLLNSWSRPPQIRETSSGPSAKLSSNLVYAAIHEFGGVITPKRVSKLTIPLDYVKNSSGTRTKFSARELFDSPGLLGLRSVWKSKTGRAILGSRGKGDVVALFALVDRVDMPKRRYVSKAIERTRSRASGIVDAAVRSTLSRLGLK